LKAGAYVAARTAIAPTTGVADAHKLFHQEMVAPGTEFAFRLLIVGDSKEKAEHTLADLAPALDILTSAGGQIGKGQADGQGLIKALNLTYTICSIGTDGRLVEKQLQKPVPKSAGRNKAAKESWTITLSCPGPYLSTDASRQRDPRIPRDETKAEPHVYAQRFDDTTPIVSGTSIMGALRARAAWLHALDLRLQGKDDDCIAKSIRTDETNVVRTPGDIATLNPLQRLFGVTGYRGLLCLTQAHVSGGTLWRSTSVKLDRFSGAPIDHALFEVEAFYGVKLTLSLRLETRTGSDDQVASLAERLIEDIKANGLYLGHGTNRGFGWFTNA
jgi:CRISPR/Cas system CSM-associated protein Csm3 (group 7 of RAMP superfamily)